MRGVAYGIMRELGTSLANQSAFCARQTRTQDSFDLNQSGRCSPREKGASRRARGGRVRRCAQSKADRPAARKRQGTDRDRPLMGLSLLKALSSRQVARWYMLPERSQAARRGSLLFEQQAEAGSRFRRM
jgi:hypothetical protein